MKSRKLTIDNSVKHINIAASSQSENNPLSGSMSNTNTKRSKNVKNALHNSNINPSRRNGIIIRKWTGERFKTIKWWTTICSV